MSEVLPPKTCSVDRLITVEQDTKLVLEGKKTATRRNGRYADPGETFELGGKKFEVTNVYVQSLGEMSNENAQEEGYNDKEDYKNHITSLHPGMPFLPQMKVWVHEFKQIG